jgi:glycerol-3-phosphate dehydrogenase
MTAAAAMPPWRAAAVERLAHETFDVLIVGAGATGAAVARDAALRGLRVALCDRGDFASATSSQSSKLLHGGLRYLQYGDLRLVFEALAERHRMMATAPHLCRPVEFVFPAYAGLAPSLPLLHAGVALYDALALWRPPAGSRRVDPAELRADLPLLRTAGLAGAIVYTDCQTDDARLVLETALDAERAGAVIASYVEIEPPGPRRAYLHAVAAVDRLTGARLSIRTHAIVNATGPFSDAFRGGARLLRPTLGVHIVVAADRLPTRGRAVVLRSPRDGRLVFALPAGARTFVGTTDTDFIPPGRSIGAPSPDDDIEARAADVDYLVETVRHAFPATALGRGDVLSTWAGLRPLVAPASAGAPSSTSREHEIVLDGRGLLTIAGGKLTTMRSMAEEAVDLLVDRLRAHGLDRPLAACTTRTRPLPGAGAAGEGLPAGVEAGEDVRDHLLRTYGARAPQVLALALARPSLVGRLSPDLPYLAAEIVFAVRDDRACTLVDVLRRRVPLFRDAMDQGLGTLETAADLVAAELGWGTERRAVEIRAYTRARAASRRWTGCESDYTPA